MSDSQHPFASKSGITNPWFQVQLDGTAIVKRVIIINRKDCCGERLRNLEVRAGIYDLEKYWLVEGNFIEQHISLNSHCGNYAGPGTTGETIEIYCNPKITANYVTVQMLGHQIAIAFQEIMIFGPRKNQGKYVIDY